MSKKHLEIQTRWQNGKTSGPRGRRGRAVGQIGPLSKQDAENLQERMVGTINRGCLAGLDSANPDFLHLVAPGEKGTRSGRWWGTSPYPDGRRGVCEQGRKCG